MSTKRRILRLNGKLDIKQTTLNTDIISKCRDSNKYNLANFDTKDY